MAEELLLQALNCEIQIELLLYWLFDNTQEDSHSINTANACLQGEFISHFLDYLHKNATCLQKKPAEMPLKHKHVSIDSDSDVNLDDSVSQNVTATSTSLMNDSTSFNISTPLLNKTSVRNASFASVVSPVCSNTTPKPTSTPQSGQKQGICLGDFLTQKTSSTKKLQRATRTRRINPTNLEGKINRSFLKTENSFNFKADVEEMENVGNTRDLMVEERLKIISRNASRNTTQLRTTPRKIKPVPMLANEIQPHLGCVTFKIELDILVHIYGTLLQRGVILNVTSELHFVLTLLLTQQNRGEAGDEKVDSKTLGVAILESDDEDLDLDFLEDCDISDVAQPKPRPPVSYFKTVHNCVYFASRVLAINIDILKILDRPALKLLIENKRLAQFSPEIIKQVTHIYQSKPEKRVEVFEQAAQPNVCFSVDRDNRQNFVNDLTFHAFCKQRDLFYEILRHWEMGHMKPGWKFLAELLDKIEALLRINCSVVNLTHLAQLFKNQMVVMCEKNYSGKNVAESELDLISSFANISAEKLSRLKSRLVTKENTAGINSIPTFNGYEDFFKDFVVAIANHVFIRHLTDTIVSDIVDLDDSVFNSTHIEELENATSALRTSYLSCLRPLRLLAKFLGFLESLPYRIDKIILPQSVLEIQIKNRSQARPNLQLQPILENSFSKDSLILTIPWMVTYIAMLDYVTLRLPYFERIFQLLFEIYFTPKSSTNTENSTFIKLCLGWLFDLPVFPKKQFFNFYSKHVKFEKHLSLKASNQIETDDELPHIRLDFEDIVDQNIVHICCPYIEEIKKLLQNNSSNNVNVTLKHITPLTDSQCSTEIIKQRTESKMHNAFFNANPSSVKKAVEFVGERVASVGAKFICSEIVAKWKRSALMEFDVILNDVEVPDNTEDDVVIKDRLKLQGKTIADRLIVNIEEEIEDKIYEIIENRVRTSLECLLPVDIGKQVKAICIYIATEICAEKLQVWIETHINSDIFVKEMRTKIEKALARDDTDDDSDNDSDNDTTDLDECELELDKKLDVCDVETTIPKMKGAFSVTLHLKGFIGDLLDDSSCVTESDVTKLLDDLLQCLEGDCDAVKYYVNNNINSHLCHFSILLVANSLEIISKDSIQQKFMTIWKKTMYEETNFLEFLVTPMMVDVLSCSELPENAFGFYRKMINRILEEKLVTYEQLETQCMAVLAENWSGDILKQLSSCLQGVVDSLIQKGGNPTKFTVLVSSLSQLCLQVDDLK